MATKVKLIADGVITPDQITLTTASTGTNTTAPATTAFVQQEISALVDSSPDALNTLNELAAALGDDANFSTTVTNSIALKAPLASPTLTGTVTVDTDANSKFTIADGGLDAITLYGGSGDELYIGANAAYKLRFKTDGNIVMDNGGSFGIGTTNPSADLHIGKTSGSAVLKVDTTATADAGIQIKGYDAYVALGDATNGLQWYVWNDGPSASSSLKFGSQALSASDWYADASQAMVITSSGNVGIGNTSPSPLYWPNGSTGGLFLQAGALLSAYNAGTNLSQNWYYNAGEKFIGNGGASRYVQSGQEHIWSHSTAVNSSGAGAGLTWSESMRIDSSGNVGIGTDNPIAPLTINNYLASASNNTDIFVKNPSVEYTNDDPHIYNAAPDGIIVTSNTSRTDGPDKMGLVLYNDDATAGGFSPMLLFAKRETGSTPFRASMAAIYAKSPSGTGNSDAWIDGQLHFGTAGAGTEGVKSRLIIDSKGDVAIGSSTTGLTNGSVGPTLKISSDHRGVDVALALEADSGEFVLYSYANKFHMLETKTAGGVNYLTTLKHDGNFGIGDTNPGQKLTVDGNIEMTAGSSRRIFMGGDAGATFGLAYDSSNPDYGIFYTEASPDVVNISPNGNAAAGAMTIYGNSRVGIGTTSANAGLTVSSGDIRATGAAFANDANSISMSWEGSNGGYITARGPSTSQKGTIGLSVNQSNGGGGTIGLQIDSSGRATTPVNPAFRARATSGQSTASSWRQVGYDTLVSSRATGYNTTNSRFTAPVAGWYQFNASWTANNNGDIDGTLSLTINGSFTDLAGSVSMPDTGGNYDGHVISGCCYLAVNDYVEVYRYSTVSTTTRGSNPYGGWFSGFLIG